MRLYMWIVGMMADSRGKMRPHSNSRSPPFVLVGLLVVIAILAFNYWGASSRNSDLLEELDNLKDQLQQSVVKVEKNVKLGDTRLDEITKLTNELEQLKQENDGIQTELREVNDQLTQVKTEAQRCEQDKTAAQDNVAECKTEKDEGDKACHLEKEEIRQENGRQLDETQEECKAQIFEKRMEILNVVNRLWGKKAMMVLEQANIDTDGVDLAQAADVNDLPNNEQPAQLQAGNQQQQPQGQLPQEQQPQGQQPQGQQPQDQQPQGQLPQDQQPQGQLPQGQLPQASNTDEQGENNNLVAHPPQGLDAQQPGEKHESSTALVSSQTGSNAQTDQQHTNSTATLSQTNNSQKDSDKQKATDNAENSDTNDGKTEDNLTDGEKKTDSENKQTDDNKKKQTDDKKKRDNKMNETDDEKKVDSEMNRTDDEKKVDSEMNQTYSPKAVEGKTEIETKDNGKVDTDSQGTLNGGKDDERADAANDSKQAEGVNIQVAATQFAGNNQARQAELGRNVHQPQPQFGQNVQPPQPQFGQSIQTPQFGQKIQAPQAQDVQNIQAPQSQFGQKIQTSQAQFGQMANADLGDRKNPDLKPADDLLPTQGIARGHMFDQEIRPEHDLEHESQGGGQPAEEGGDFVPVDDNGQPLDGGDRHAPEESEGASKPLGAAAMQDNIDRHVELDENLKFQQLDRQEEMKKLEDEETRIDLRRQQRENGEDDVYDDEEDEEDDN